MKYVALAPLLFVVSVAVSLVIGKVLRGPSTTQREAVEDAPTAGCCRCYALDGEQHDPWCSRRPPTVVAGSDLDPLERLYAAPAYGEGR